MVKEVDNVEISINHIETIWNRVEIIIDDIFVFSVITDIMNDDL